MADRPFASRKPLTAEEKAAVQARFDEWMAAIDERIAALKAFVSLDVAAQLDGSITSLIPLEAVILDNFADGFAVNDPDKKHIVDMIEAYLAPIMQRVAKRKLQPRFNPNQHPFDVPALYVERVSHALWVSPCGQIQSTARRRTGTNLHDWMRRWEHDLAPHAGDHVPAPETPDTDPFDEMLDASIAEEDAKSAKRR